MLIQSGNSFPRPTKKANVMLEYSKSMWMTRRRRDRRDYQQLYIPSCIKGSWYKYQRSKTLPRESTYTITELS